MNTAAIQASQPAKLTALPARGARLGSSMEIVGPLLGVVVGAWLTWLQSAHGARDARRRDAWATWAEQAYRLTIARRQLVERLWAVESGANFSQSRFDARIADDLTREIKRDVQLNAALARVLLADPSRSRRKQARAFTDLLSDAIDIGSGTPKEDVFGQHIFYVEALEATIDELLGSYADGTTTQVADWFSRKLEQLTSKGEKQLPYVDDEPEARK